MAFGELESTFEADSSQKKKSYYYFERDCEYATFLLSFTFYYCLCFGFCLISQFFLLYHKLLFASYNIYVTGPDILSLVQVQHHQLGT